MGSFSIWHWLIVLVIVLVLFGGGKLPRLASDLAKGIKNFKAGLRDEDEAPAGSDPKVIKSETAAPASGQAAKKDETART